MTCAAKQYIFSNSERERGGTNHQNSSCFVFCLYQPPLPKKKIHCDEYLLIERERESFKNPAGQLLQLQLYELNTYQAQSTVYLNLIPAQSPCSDNSETWGFLGNPQFPMELQVCPSENGQN